MKNKEKNQIQLFSIIKSIIVVTICAVILFFITANMSTEQWAKYNFINLKISGQILVVSIILYWLFKWLPHLYKNIIYLIIGSAGMLVFIVSLFTKSLVACNGYYNELEILLSLLFIEKMMLLFISTYFIMESRTELQYST